MITVIRLCQWVLRRSGFRVAAAIVGPASVFVLVWIPLRVDPAGFLESRMAEAQVRLSALLPRVLEALDLPAANPTTQQESP